MFYPQSSDHAQNEARKFGFAREHAKLALAVGAVEKTNTCGAGHAARLPAVDRAPFATVRKE